MTMHIDLSQARTAYSVSGEGPPILLIHGYEATRNSFAALTSELSKSMTVYSYDQRDCGETQSKVSANSLLELVDDAAELIRALGIKNLMVLGTSFGGRLAQGLAIQHPDLVARLVLCNTWPIDIALESANWMGVARLATLRMGLPATARWLAQSYYGSAYVDSHPELVERFAQKKPKNPRTMLIRKTHGLRLEGITVPSLLISGTSDPIVPTRIMRGMQTRIEGSTLVEIPGAHHAVTVERPLDVSLEIEEFCLRAAPCIATN